MQMLDDSLGEAVGQLYVAKYWPAATAKQAQELVDDMHAAYAEKISNASWMDSATRRAALAKLASFDPRIGHPVRWIDYSTLEVSPTIRSPIRWRPRRFSGRCSFSASRVRSIARCGS